MPHCSGPGVLAAAPSLAALRFIGLRVVPLDKAVASDSHRKHGVAISLAICGHRAQRWISPGGQPVALRKETTKDTVGRRTRKSDHKGEVANLAEWI